MAWREKEEEGRPRAGLPLLYFRGRGPGYFFAGLPAGLASGAGVGAAAVAPAAPGAPGAPAAPGSPAAAVSSFLTFFFRTTFCTRVFGSPNGLRPSGNFPSSSIFRMRSDRFSTQRLRIIPPFRFRLLSIDMGFVR